MRSIKIDDVKTLTLPDDGNTYKITVDTSGPSAYWFPSNEGIKTIWDGKNVSYVYNDQMYSLDEIIRLRKLKTFW